MYVKVRFSEKATKFWEISTLLLSTIHTDKSKVEISENFVAFSKYINFITNSCPIFLVITSNLVDNQFNKFDFML